MPFRIKKLKNIHDSYVKLSVIAPTAFFLAVALETEYQNHVRRPSWPLYTRALSGHSSSHYYTSELEQNYISPSRIELVNWENRKGNVFDYL